MHSGKVGKILEEAHKLAHSMIAGNEIYGALLLLLAAGNLANNEM
jgi:hypothetical protein